MYLKKYFYLFIKKLLVNLFNIYKSINYLLNFYQLNLNEKKSISSKIYKNVFLKIKGIYKMFYVFVSYNWLLKKKKKTGIIQIKWFDNFI
jgi:hypothetical protein